MVVNLTEFKTLLGAGHSELVLWDNPEGWGGEGGRRRGSGWWDTCTRMDDSCRCMAKTTTIL